MAGRYISSPLIQRVDLHAEANQGEKVMGGLSAVDCFSVAAHGGVKFVMDAVG